MVNAGGGSGAVGSGNSTPVGAPVAMVAGLALGRFGVLQASSASPATIPRNSGPLIATTTAGAAADVTPFT